MTKMKKFISVILTLILCLQCVSLTAYAIEDKDLRYFQRGVLTDGTNTAYYVIDKDNNYLYICNDSTDTHARTPDYAQKTDSPIAGRKDISTIVICDGVSYVGDYCCADISSADRLIIKSNLLSSENSVSSKAFIGCTGLRHVQGGNSAISTDSVISIAKIVANIISANWLSLAKEAISGISGAVQDDGTLDDEVIDAVVNDYIMNGNSVFLGDLNEMQEEYNERLASPCYSNNAFHHDYSDFVSKEPTCTEAGETKYVCGVCGESYTTPIAPLGHNFEDSVLFAQSCFTEGIEKHYCTRCGTASYNAIAPYGHHSYDSLDYDAQNDTYTKVCSVCQDRNTQFDNDTSALISAVNFAEGLAEEDYLYDSYSALPPTYERYKDLKTGDYLQYPQSVIDEKTADILTAINNLIPEVRLHLISAKGGSVTATYEMDGKVTNVREGINHLVPGVAVTMTALPSDGSTFYGWYDTTDRRYVSSDVTFTYVVGSDTRLKAVFRPEGSARLAFVLSEDNEQYYAEYVESCEFWIGVTSLSDFVPAVPHNFGYTDRAWEYNEAEVLNALRNGEDVTIYNTTEVPAQPGGETLPAGSSPVLHLTKHSDTNIDATDVNYLELKTALPQDIRIQEIGLLLYYKKKSSGFDPSTVAVSLNKRTLSSLYYMQSDNGIYVTNLSAKFNDYNIAVKGYINYYGEDGRVKTCYSDQINITDANRFE